MIFNKFLQLCCHPLGPVLEHFHHPKPCPFMKLFIYYYKDSQPAVDIGFSPPPPFKILFLSDLHSQHRAQTYNRRSRATCFTDCARLFIALNCMSTICCIGPVFWKSKILVKWQLWITVKAKTIECILLKRVQIVPVTKKV